MINVGLFCPKAHFFGYRHGAGAHSNWVIDTDMLSEHESTFCIGLTTNEDVGRLDFFFSFFSFFIFVFYLDWTFSPSDELEIPHFQAKVKPMMQTDHVSDLRPLTI